uniref:Uncharacterized protein n=1 Tax=Cucumis melo TaxID=3656 RepID=A0A9I9E5W5_CUCME
MVRDPSLKPFYFSSWSATVSRFALCFPSRPRLLKLTRDSHFYLNLNRDLTRLPHDSLFKALPLATTTLKRCHL